MSWQWVLVGLVELGALSFLVWKLAGGRLKRPRVLQRPDVPASALVRQKGEGGGTGSRRGGGVSSDP